MRKINIPILAGLLFLLSCSSPDGSSKYEVQKGNFEASITESGELQAINAVGIIMPPIGFRYGWQFKLIDLVENGTVVKAGDTIAKIDQAPVRKRIIELETNFDLEKANLNKLIIEQNNQVNSLSTTLAEEKANFDLKMLELETFKFESPQKQNIKQLEFEQVQIRKKRAEDNIQRQEIIRTNKIKIQKIKIQQIKIDIQNAYKALERLTITSPINGIVQVKKNRRTKQNYKIGDDLFLGQSFALVPDIKYMKVKTTINELDYKKAKVGQKVIIRLDALPEVAFEGEICYLGKLSKPKEKDSKIKVFDTEITIEKSDERLKPGMTVSCQILYANFKDIMYVSNDCLMQENGKYFVFTKSNKKQEVQVGPSNNKHTVIHAHLEEGQSLIPIHNHKATNEQKQG